MSIDGWISGLNYLNAGLGGANNYIDAKSNGATTGQAALSGGSIWALNTGRVAIADSMRQDYGTYMGHTVNNLAGWSTPQSNAAGYTGLFATGMFHEMMRPSCGFGNPFGMGMYGMSPFGGMCGGGMFGMSSFGMNPFMMGGMYRGGFFC